MLSKNIHLHPVKRVHPSLIFKWTLPPHIQFLLLLCYSEALFTHPETDIHHHNGSFHRAFWNYLHQILRFPFNKVRSETRHRFLGWGHLQTWNAEVLKKAFIFLDTWQSAMEWPMLSGIYEKDFPPKNMILSNFRYMDICMGLSLLVSLVSLEYGSMSGERGPLALFLILR